MIIRSDLFSKIRTSLFHDHLFQAQVDGITAILDEWERQELKDMRWLAYMLATTYHETSKTMQPIEEWGKGKGRKYGLKMKRSGIPYETPDKIYYGRGLIQLTWYENYQQMGRLLGVALLDKPELACNMKIAVRIMFEGMMKGASSFGDFTGKCLEMYFNDTTNDPINARKIINGLDCANLIADYHHKFLDSLS